MQVEQPDQQRERERDKSLVEGMKEEAVSEVSPRNLDHKRERSIER